MICKRSETDGQLYKMSKSKGNVVSPDALIRDYGSDTVRLYTLFIGPPEKDAEWNDRGIEGAARFLKRLWRRHAEHRGVLAEAADLACDPARMDRAERDLYRKVHETIERVTRDMEGAFHFNAAIAQIMELCNAIDGLAMDDQAGEQRKAVFRAAMEATILLVSPFAPHIAEELWEQLGHAPSVLQAPWPEVDPAALVRDEIDVVVQVNGKVRGHVTVAADATREDLEAAALAEDSVRKHLAGKTVRKVIVVPGKLVNVAVS